MAYDQVILIPGGGATGTGARQVLDLLFHPESMGVDLADPRWRGWSTTALEVAKRLSEPSTGYGVRSVVLDQIDALVATSQRPVIGGVRVFGVPGPGPVKRRSRWSKLTPAYRRRLERSGISRASWESGADLRAARGHAPAAPRGAADFAATLRFVTGQGTPDDARKLSAFAEMSKPGWLPNGLDYDVVAALSQLRGTPSKWESVYFVPAPDGQPWAMIVRSR